ncbi:lipocalin family protein [Lacinutrix cladophorae]
MKNIILFFSFCFILISCSSDSSNNNENTIVGNWIIQQITYNGLHGNWGECGHLENISFYEDNTYAWVAYALADEFINCVPIPPAEGTWEQIDYNTVQLTDDDIVFDMDYDDTYLYLNAFIPASQNEPEGIHIQFVFIKS